MLFYIGMALIVIGFVFVITQMNFKNEVTPIQVTSPPLANTTTTTTTQSNPNNTQSTSSTSSLPLAELPPFLNGNQEITMQMGRMISTGTVSDLMTNHHSVSWGTNKVLDFYIIDRNIYVDTTLFGNDANPQVEIKKNVLVSYPKGWDMNSDGSAIEIVDDRQNPVYQLIFKTHFDVAVNGFLYFPGGFLFVDQDGRMFQNYAGDYSLSRLFKYPSSAFPGQRMPTTTP